MEAILEKIIELAEKFWLRLDILLGLSDIKALDFLKPLLANISSDPVLLGLTVVVTTIILYSIYKNKIIKQKKSEPITSISFGSNDRSLVSAHNDKRIRFWEIDSETGRINFLDKSPELHSDYISRVIAYKELIITSSLDGYIRFLDTDYNEKANLFIENSGDWIIINSDGYYKGKGSILDKYNPNKQKEGVLKKLF